MILMEASVIINAALDPLKRALGQAKDATAQSTRQIQIELNKIRTDQARLSVEALRQDLFKLKTAPQELQREFRESIDDTTKRLKQAEGGVRGLEAEFKRLHPTVRMLGPIIREIMLPVAKLYMALHIGARAIDNIATATDEWGKSNDDVGLKISRMLSSILGLSPHLDSAAGKFYHLKEAQEAFNKVAEETKKLIDSLAKIKEMKTELRVSIDTAGMTELQKEIYTLESKQKEFKIKFGIEIDAITGHRLEDITRKLKEARDAVESWKRVPPSIMERATGTISQLSELEEQVRTLETEYKRLSKAATEAGEAQKIAAEKALTLKTIGRKIEISIQTPFEKYGSTFADLNLLLEKGAISWTVYTRAVEKAREELDKAVMGPATRNKEAMTNLTKMLADAQEKLATHGMKEPEKEIWKAHQESLKPVGEEEGYKAYKIFRQIQETLTNISKIDAINKINEEWVKFAEGVREFVQTPLEKAIEYVNKLAEAVKRGMKPSDAMKAYQKTVADLKKTEIKTETKIGFVGLEDMWKQFSMSLQVKDPNTQYLQGIDSNTKPLVPALQNLTKAIDNFKTPIVE